MSIRNRFLGLAVLAALAASVHAGPPATASGSPRGIDDFLTRGEVSGHVGSAIHLRRNSDTLDSGLAWGYVEGGYTSPRWQGFQFGGYLLGVPEIWEENEGDFSKSFTETLDVRDLYLSWSGEDGNSPATVTAGRKKFPKNPTMDGDTHEGAFGSVTLGSKFSLDGGVVSRWQNHSSTKYDADGISGWDDVDEANPDAAGAFLFLNGRVDAAEGLAVTPFAGFQENVLGVLGSGVTVAVPLHDNAGKAGPVWTTEGIVAFYGNQVPDSIEPDYEDVWSYRIHTGMAKDGYAAGIGFYWLGDERNAITAGMFDDFHPMKEDELYPLNDRNDAHLVYFDASAPIGRGSLKAVLGLGRNEGADADSVEFDLFFDHPLTERITLAGYFVWVDFSGGDPDLEGYVNFGTSVDYAF